MYHVHLNVLWNLSSDKCLKKVFLVFLRKFFISYIDICTLGKNAYPYYCCDMQAQISLSMYSWPESFCTMLRHVSHKYSLSSCICVYV